MECQKIKNFPQVNANKTNFRRTKFYSQQGKCIYQNSVSTYCSRLSVELSILMAEYVTTKILLLKL